MGTGSLQIPPRAAPLLPGNDLCSCSPSSLCLFSTAWLAACSIAKKRGETTLAAVLLLFWPTVGAPERAVQNLELAEFFSSEKCFTLGKCLVENKTSHRSMSIQGVGGVIHFEILWFCSNLEEKQVSKLHYLPEKSKFWFHTAL